MRRGVEVPRHLHSDPRPGGELAGPPHQQIGVFGHPLQGGVADDDIGVGLRCPRPHVADVSVDTAFAGRRHHLGRAVPCFDDGTRPALREGDGEIAGTTAEVDHPPRRLDADPRQQVEERATAMVGEGQVDVGIPHDASVAPPSNSQLVRSCSTGQRLVKTGTVCVVTALADSQVAAQTTAATRTDRWPRWALAVLLAATAVLYLWNLSASGYGNTFYAAAAQAGSQSWSAWFFGSLDAQNFITVDKPPASLWVTGLSVRLFGTNSWSVMAPQALMGVAAVAVLYCAARRAFTDPNQGAAAGLLAGAVLAGTPAAALMFRFNNPDALLALLLTVAAYCLMRATPAASWRWLLLVGVAMGFAFLAKMLQGFLVLPGFGLAYLLFAPTSWPKRVLHLLGAVGALIAAAGWWVLAVQLTPASARPYIGGSTDNTVL